MDSKSRILWSCQSCGRLLLCPKDGDWKMWYFHQLDVLSMLSDIPVAMVNPKLVIIIANGCFHGVFASHDCEYLVIDHDTVDEDEEVTFTDPDGERVTASMMKAAATELARRCQILESRGEVPTNHNAIWTWED